MGRFKSSIPSRSRILTTRDTVNCKQIIKGLLTEDVTWQLKTTLAAIPFHAWLSFSYIIFSGASSNDHKGMFNEMCCFVTFQGIMLYCARKEVQEGQI